MADHLIDGTHQLARINWEAVDRSKPGTRGSNIWMVEANVASLSKKVLTTQLNLLTTECFTVSGAT
jgi:hypothetical protein